METFDWLVVEMNLKVEWRSVLQEFGGQCVMTFGIQVMRELFAGNWVSMEERQVLHSYFVYYAILWVYTLLLQLVVPSLNLVREVDSSS